MSETPITDAVPHNVPELAMMCRKLERDLRKCEAGAAVMRDALQRIVGDGFKFPLEHYNAIAFGALNVEAGRELLAEVELLRFGCNQVAQVAFERDEAVRENLTLRSKVAAAEGMATTLALCAKIPICVYPEGLYIDLEDHAAIIATLAAWKEANK